ncbi:MAG: stage II sporulation protein M [Tissierellia bacterium]|nr:stage II sporulation protein M [Tissierellia bacterium]
MYRIGQGLGEIRKIFIYCLLIFIIIGLISTFYFNDKEELVAEIISSFLEEKADIFIEDGPSLGLDGNFEENSFEISVKGLFLNNLKASVISNLLGIIPFIFLPALVLIVNAGLIGTVFAMGGMGIGLSNPELLIGGILPHGIFEIPALLISISMGLYLSSQVSKKLLRRDHQPIFKLLTRQLFITLFIVVPLLLLAAFIEARITPMILFKLL